MGRILDMGHLKAAFFELGVDLFEIFMAQQGIGTDQRDGQDFFVRGFDGKPAGGGPQGGNVFPGNLVGNAPGPAVAAKRLFLKKIRDKCDFFWKTT